MKNFRKWIEFAGMILVLAVVFGLVLPMIYAPKTGILVFEQIYDYEADFFNDITNLQQMLQASDAVVVFQPEEYVSRSVYRGRDSKIIGGSVTNVLSGNLQPGDKIEIMEYCDFNDTQLFTYDCYYPMSMGQSYLLFLDLLEEHPLDAGRYTLVNRYMGKYALNARTGIFADIYLDKGLEYELAIGTDYQKLLAERYLKQWYPQVREMYAEVFK